MGKSKSGGTRSYIRGRVGADVYSIGRDAKGKKQQIVRSLAETVANPQTTSQMRGRMIMATIMQALAALKPVIDHSFDNVSGKQPNLSEFIARNYALIKADVAANPASGNKFGLNMYLEKGAKRGQYIIADGKALIPSALVLTPATGVITITLPSDAITVAGLKSALGMTSEEYFTLVGITANGGAEYERFRVNPTLAGETAITSENVASVFAIEGNANAQVALASNTITITLSSVATCCAVIVSKKANGTYVHNEAVLSAGTDFEYAAEIALPTYPVGAADYLNGGDIYGASESFPDGGGVSPSPSPEPEALRATALKVDGTTRSLGYTIEYGEYGNTAELEITFSGTPMDGTYKVIQGQSNTYAVGDTASVRSTIGSVTSATFSKEQNFNAVGGVYLVDADNKVKQLILKVEQEEQAGNTTGD